MRMLNRIARSITTLAIGGVIAATGVLGASDALAIDKIYLKDGRIVEGTIKEDLDGYLWVLTTIGGIETDVMYEPQDILKVERDADASTPQKTDEPARAATAPKRDSNARDSNVTRAAVISLGDHRSGKDMVGTYMTADSIRKMIPMLEEDLGSDGSGILVLRISSGGGFLLEIQRLSDVIQNELKPKFRVVAWIDSAISAAAMTAHAVEEIYFTTGGNYGACTGWSGALVAMKGRGLEEVFFMMEEISDRGGYDHKIMAAMQHNRALSCTIDDFGQVKWYESEDDGQYLVNPADKILTFNSQNALKYGFSKGTADTIDELARAMNMPEIEWVGEFVAGIPYPVSQAEKFMREYRDQVKIDEDRTREYFDRYNNALAAAQGTPREQRGPFLNKARKALKLIQRMVKNTPNFALLIFNMETMEEFDEWVREQERIIRELGR